ncbi:hypothetical protein J1614_004420 [Plenodomus biglobosus]|nr:hypothetical protein J1614_004420 [Plenodomus biglobosus]
MVLTTNESEFQNLRQGITLFLVPVDAVHDGIRCCESDGAYTSWDPGWDRTANSYNDLNKAGHDTIVSNTLNRSCCM